MAQIIIVEDDAAHLNHLYSLLRTFESKHADCVFEIRTYQNPQHFLAEYACDADLIFLDIQMAEMDGMKVARRIRKVDDQVMLIFTTAMTQYAIAGYEVQAFDYILKPLTTEMFEAKLKRALRVLNYKHDEEWIDISTKTETRRIRVNQITYIEIDNHDVLIHTERETYRHWGSLKEYEARLEPLHFARCNSCYLVNLKYVGCLRSASVMVGSEELVISRSKRKDFLTAFARYKGGSL